jgi:hypothetical protein
MSTFEASVNDLMRNGIISKEVGQNFLSRRTAGSRSVK